MKQNTNTIILTGGGSGGHITPLLSLAHELKGQNPQCKIIYIGLKGDKVEGLQSHYKAFDAVFYLSAGKFRRYHGESFLAHLIDLKTLVLNARDLFRVIRGLFSAWRLLGRTKPELVFSKGGFVAVPVGLAARVRRIPIITHDSDAIPGLANRIIGRWAKIHATGMPAQSYSYPKDSIRYTGIPVAVDFKPVSAQSEAEFKNSLGLPSSAVVITVLGGGLGSHSVNQLVLGSTKKLLDASNNLHILHISGQDHQTELADQYNMLLVDNVDRVEVIGFTDELYKYTGAADLVITRAGATAIAELAMQKKPTIIIPSPFLSGGHQLKNATALEKAQAVVVLPNDATPDQLIALVNDLLSNTEKRQKLSENIGLLSRPNAAKDLAELLLEEIRR